MKAVLTSIELKSPLHFFSLSRQAFKIIKQLNRSPHLDFKKRGLWTTHFTMTLWTNEEELLAFARSGAHLEAMKNSAKIAKEIRTLTIDAEALPSWKEAQGLLERASVIRY